MAYVGGVRARLIHENIYNIVKDGLTTIGWFDEDRDHAPLDVRTAQVPRDESIAPNIVCVTVEDVNENEEELGSNLASHVWDYYIDVYAEDAVLGLHLSTDIKDILSGRFSSLNRIGPTITVYDLTQTAATPIELFTVDIENIDSNRARFFEKPFQEFWWVVSFNVRDIYNNEDDT